MNISWEEQKQASGGVMQKRCSKKFPEIRKKATVPDSLFLIKLYLKRASGSFPVNSAKCSRTPFLQNTSA